MQKAQASVGIDETSSKDPACWDHLWHECKLPYGRGKCTLAESSEEEGVAHYSSNVQSDSTTVSVSTR